MIKKIILLIYTTKVFAFVALPWQDGQICTDTISCPQGYTETTGSETSKGECKKTIEYTYYNYLCNNSKNEQGYNYTPINSGGNCTKTDSSNTISNPELSNPCNNSTPPVNNCKREKFMCQANKDRPCSFVDNSSSTFVISA